MKIYFKTKQNTNDIICGCNVYSEDSLIYSYYFKTDRLDEEGALKNLTLHTLCDNKLKKDNLLVLKYENIDFTKAMKKFLENNKKFIENDSTLITTPSIFLSDIKANTILDNNIKAYENNLIKYKQRER